MKSAAMKTVSDTQANQQRRSNAWLFCIIVLTVVLGLSVSPSCALKVANRKFADDVKPDIESKLRRHVFGSQAEIRWNSWGWDLTGSFGRRVSIPGDFAVRSGPSSRWVDGHTFADFDQFGRLSKVEIFFHGVDSKPRYSSYHIQPSDFPRLGFIPSFTELFRGHLQFDFETEIENTGIKVSSGGGGGFLLLTYK
jgi:hypothetical protein